MAIALKLGKTVLVLDGWTELDGATPVSTATDAVLMALQAAGEMRNGKSGS
jgi:hypothetical protein